MVANLPVEEWHTVHQRLRRIAKRRAELDAEEARCLRDAERIQLWRRLGYVHMGEYLERELGYAPHQGAERLRVARALAELPQLEAQLGEGALHYSAVRELSRVATRETEAEWIEAARGKNVRQVEAAISGHKRGDRPDSPTCPELVNRIVRLELSPDVFALFRQAQATLADEHGGRLDDNAFIRALCRCALESPGAADHARPAHQIAITVCQSCKRGWQNGAGREIEVGPEVVERAQCDAEHLGSLDAAQPARVTATVTPRLRRQVLARDHHCCTVPGCRSARNLDLHHITYQSDGGSHEIGNVTTLCTGHHQQLHEGALVIRGRAPDGLEFTWRVPAAPALAAVQRADFQREADMGEHDAPAERERQPASQAPGIAAPIAQRPSHRGPHTSSHTPGSAPSAASNEPGLSRGGPETTSHSPGIAAAMIPVAQGPSRGGPEITSHSLGIAAAMTPFAQDPSHGGPQSSLHARSGGPLVQRDQSHGGPDATSRGPGMTAPCHIDQGLSYGGPEGILCEPKGEVTAEPVAQVQSHGGLTPTHRPATEIRNLMTGDATSAPRTGRPSPTAGASSDRNIRVSTRPPRDSATSSIDDSIDRDVRGALTTAGYKPHEARRATKEARSLVGPGGTLEQLLREALRRCVRAVERQ